MKILINYFRDQVRKKKMCVVLCGRMISSRTLLNISTPFSHRMILQNTFSYLTPGPHPASFWWLKSFLYDLHTSNSRWTSNPENTKKTCTLEEFLYEKKCIRAVGHYYWAYYQDFTQEKLQNVVHTRPQIYRFQPRSQDLCRRVQWNSKWIWMSVMLGWKVTHMIIGAFVNFIWNFVLKFSQLYCNFNKHIHHN